MFRDGRAVQRRARADKGQGPFEVRRRPELRGPPRGLRVRRDGAAAFSDTVPAGAVVGTDPGPGTVLPIGGEVTLVLSRGAEPPPEPEEVRVPLVLGRDAAGAAEILEDAGFAVTERNRLPFLSRENATVVGQDPGAGALVEDGSTVVIDTL